MTKPTEKLEDLKHSERPRILIRFGNIVIDYQNVFAAGRRLRQKCDVAVGRLACQFSRPSFGEYRAINSLMPLCTRCQIGSASCALVMDDLAERLIQNFVTGLPNLER